MISAKQTLIGIPLLFAGLAAHVLFGHHTLLLHNCRANDIHGMSISVGDRHQLESVPSGAWRASTFDNPWPHDGTVDLLIRAGDGSVERHRCLFLGILPHVASIRLLPNGVVDCTLLGASMLVPLPSI